MRKPDADTRPRKRRGLFWHAVRRLGAWMRWRALWRRGMGRYLLAHPLMLDNFGLRYVSRVYLDTNRILIGDDVGVITDAVYRRSAVMLDNMALLGFPRRYRKPLPGFAARLWRAMPEALHTRGGADRGYAVDEVLPPGVVHVPVFWSAEDARLWLGRVVDGVDTSVERAKLAARAAQEADDAAEAE